MNKKKEEAGNWEAVPFELLSASNERTNEGECQEGWIEVIPEHEAHRRWSVIAALTYGVLC